LKLRPDHFLSELQRLTAISDMSAEYGAALSRLSPPKARGMSIDEPKLFDEECEYLDLESRDK
jgi:hypothetical protein